MSTFISGMKNNISSMAFNSYSLYFKCIYMNNSSRSFLDISKLCNVNYISSMAFNSYSLQWSQFFRWSMMIFILKGFRTIVFIFIIVSTTFRPICPPAFFRSLSNSGNCTEHRTTSFIESMGVACSDSVSHNRVQVLSIPVLLLVCSQDWTCNHLMIVSLEA